MPKMRGQGDGGFGLARVFLLGGKVIITDGPYLKTTENVGGFRVLEAADLNEALAWGRKAAISCRAPVEVRPFH